ncbi:hypothetical protein ACIQ4I_11275 [Rummeliibacillus sp. NPDC094406]|uniref:hypothetical protein n=1 Tax=Rummeliibacillus sp. NPDC094406 TaxID=3364511 RepID=UPI0038102DA5
MKKIVLSFIIGILILSVLPSTSNASNEIGAGFGKSPEKKGVIIYSTVKISGEKITDLYMSVKTARNYAESLPPSNERQTLAFIAGLGIGAKSPQAAAILGMHELTDSMNRGTAATKIRKYTNKNQKVHFTIYQSFYMGKALKPQFTVKRWDGKISEIKTEKGLKVNKKTYLYK